jgi:hypothetical protein
MSDPKRVLRIHVTEGDNEKVNIRIPLGLAKLAGLGGFADKISKEQGVDVGAILRSLDETPDGKIIDVVDEHKGEHVEIFVETPVAAGA